MCTSRFYGNAHAHFCCVFFDRFTEPTIQVRTFNSVIKLYFRIKLTFTFPHFWSLWNNMVWKSFGSINACAVEISSSSESDMWLYLKLLFYNSWQINTWRRWKGRNCHCLGVCSGLKCSYQPRINSRDCVVWGQVILPVLSWSHWAGGSSYIFHEVTEELALSFCLLMYYDDHYNI